MPVRKRYCRHSRKFGLINRDRRERQNREGRVLGCVNGTTINNNAATSLVLEWPIRQIDRDCRVYCAYNLSRQRFLCSYIEPADLMPENLRERLDMLACESQKALWLIPFRGISPNQINAPVDLIFLDQNYCVIAVAESFPNSQPDSCNWPVGSAVALPAGLIASSGTLAGDQLILCSPQKMNRRLFDLQRPNADKRESGTFSHNLYCISDPNSGPFKPSVQISSWDHLLSEARDQRTSVEHVPANTQLALRAEAGETEQEASPRKRNWLFCLLAPHRKERRKSPRESLPWIAAYFIDDDIAAPATIRNISSLGMYVSTRERWSPGTVIQVTLSDWRLPSPERAMTLSAKAVRSDEDGVGLRFVFPKLRRGNAAQKESDGPTEVTREELKAFLQHFKGVNQPLNWSQRIFG